MDNGETLICTPDHRVLLKNGIWSMAGNLEVGSKLMPFYRLSANQNLTKLKTNQYARVFTNRGWMHERQFVDEWSLGKQLPEFAETNKYGRLIAEGLTARQLMKVTGNEFVTIKSRLEKVGFSMKELQWLGKKKSERRVIGIQPWEEIDVYDLTVDKHHNFCTNWGVLHNCQRDEEGRVFQISCENTQIKEELEYLFFHKKMLNLDQKKTWDVTKRLFIMGDFFWEIVIDLENPKKGILNLVPLPPDTVYRIETTKGKLLEFQQSKEGPDYQSLARVEVTQATDADLQQATAIRFAPDQIIHIKIGDDRETFYPYGVSLIEAARGPAHQLRIMEDSMVVYRLSRAPERRVFYIDTFQLPPYKAEAFVERMKSQFKKKKVPNTRQGLPGASSVEERWHAPAADEDFWIPIRPNSQTRVDTLPGACLALDTKIPLLDGRTLKLSDVIKEHQLGKTLWTYSCNPTTGQIVPGKVTWAGETRKNTDVVKITLDNGKHIICTLDHKFPVLEKGFLEAQHLNVGDSLIPFNTKQNKIKPHHKSEYEQIYDVASKKWKFTHRIVADFFKEIGLHQEKIFNDKLGTAKKDTIHHLDFNRFNNNPENLTWMNGKDHFKLHEWLSSEYASIGGKARAAQVADWKGKNDPRYDAFVEKTKEQFASWRTSLTTNERQEVNQKISGSLKKFWDELSSEDRAIWEQQLKERG